MDNILVSIIIPCYNSEDYIFETIESVLAQTYNNIEVIVVDDGSTDNSWSIIKSFGNRILSIHQDNSGGCSARNNGYNLSSGNYIMFLDSDDFIESNTIENLVDIMQDGMYITACPWYRYVKHNNSWIKKPSGLPKLSKDSDFLNAWLSGWYIPPCALMWSRESLNATGHWDESLSANQDGDLVMRALLKGIKLLFTDCGASYYRHHGASVISVSSNVNSINALRSRMRVLEKITKGLDDKEILSNYKIVIGQAYHKLARNSFFVDRELARVCLERSKIYAGKDSIVGGRMHKFLCKIFGLEFKENLAYFLSKTNVYSNVYRNKYNTLKNLSKKTGTQCG